MHYLRLPRRAVRAPLAAAAVSAALAVPAGLCLVTRERAPGEADRDASPALPAALPEALAVRRLTDEQVSPEVAQAIAASPARPAGERLVALQRLEQRAPAAALAEAEGIVLSAGSSRDERTLAVNALRVLANSPDGARALERCAAEAPSEDLRRAARTLLARR